MWDLPGSGIELSLSQSFAQAGGFFTSELPEKVPSLDSVWSKWDADFH